jgi:hypothetical protein
MRLLRALGLLAILSVAQAHSASAGWVWQSRQIDIAELTENVSISPDEQTFEWDPESCWDCSSLEDTIAFFFVGFVFAAPISYWCIRRKTLKRDTLTFKRVLEI